MSELVEKLGLDWRLLLSQAVNFLVLLAVLRQFAYKPLLKLLKERREKIEEGLAKASEADRRLVEVDEIAKGKMKDTEAEAMAMLRATEEKSKKVEAAMLEEARKKEAAMLASAELAAKTKEEKAMEDVRLRAGEIVRQALIRTVEMDPKQVDEALIKKAVAEIARPGMKYDPKTYGKALAEVAAGQLDAKKEEHIVRNLARIIIERGDRAKWPKILAAAEKALREKEGLRKVTIESARPINSARADLKAFLKASDIIEEKVDPEIIAGVKITVDDVRQFDGSLARKLAKLFDASARF